MGTTKQTQQREAYIFFGVKFSGILDLDLDLDNRSWCLPKLF